MELRIAVDETWIYQYDPARKMQSMQWLQKSSKGPIKFNSKRSVQKMMATVFWDLEGIVLINFLEESKTITRIYYKGILSSKLLQLKKGQESCTEGSCSIMTMHLLTLQKLKTLS